MWTTLLVILIVLIVLLYISLDTTLSSYQVKRWMKNPRKCYLDLFKRFGFPNSISNKRHGYAIWRGPAPFERLMVVDEEIEHCCPTNHTDYLYGFICVNINDPVRLSGILSVSTSLSYDCLTHTLLVRCNSLENVVATALFITDLLLASSKEFMTVYSDSNKIKTAYAGYIENAVKQYKDNFSALKKNINSIGCTKSKCTECDKEENVFEFKQFESSYPEYGYGLIKQQNEPVVKEDFAVYDPNRPYRQSHEYYPPSTMYKLGPHANPPGSHDNKQPYTMPPPLHYFN